MADDPPRQRSANVLLPPLPPVAATYLVQVVSDGVTSWDHDDRCKLTGKSRTCPICQLARWVRQAQAFVDAQAPGTRLRRGQLEGSV
jgi:hypothetical protein